MWSVGKGKCWRQQQQCWHWALLAPLLVPLGVGKHSPQRKKRVHGNNSSNGALVSVGLIPVASWKKKSRYNKEMKKLKMEAPNRAGL